MNVIPAVAQAKAALNKNLAVTQSKLAKRTAERDEALSKIQAAEDRAEIAERSARDTARECAKTCNSYLERALAAEGALSLSQAQRAVDK